MNARTFTTIVLAAALPLAASAEGITAEQRAAALKKALEVMAIAKDKQKLEAKRDEARSLEAATKASGIMEKVKTAVGNGEIENSVKKIQERAVNDARVQDVLKGVSPQAAALIAAGQAAKPAPKPPKPPKQDKPVDLPDPIAVPTAQAETTATPVDQPPTKPADVDTGNFDPSKVTVPERQGRKSKTIEVDAGKQIIITCDDVAYFDAKSRIAIFEGNVKVDHPGFDLACDKLEVFFKPESEATPAPAGEDAPEDAPEDAAETTTSEPGVGEIDRVIATGRMVTIEKPAATGEMQIGQCKKAIFFGDTEEIEMYIWPQVQKGDYRMTATEESTVIRIDQNGTLKATGQTTSGFTKDQN